MKYFSCQSNEILHTYISIPTGDMFTVQANDTLHLIQELNLASDNCLKVMHVCIWHLLWTWSLCVLCHELINHKKLLEEKSFLCFVGTTSLCSMEWQIGRCETHFDYRCN